MAYRLAEGPKWQDFEAALATVPDIGPGGHYLGHPHTLENFQTAFFMPELFDNNSIEQWQAEGSVEITERALSYAKNYCRSIRSQNSMKQKMRNYWITSPSANGRSRPRMS